MKNKIFLLAIGICFLTLSTANAALIGVKDKLLLPDIFFDIIGQATYNSTTKIFSISALDRHITMPDKTEHPLWYDIEGYKLTTTFFLEIPVGSSGNRIGTGRIEEKVTEGTAYILYNGFWHNFPANTTLLAGDVYAFGWGEGQLLGQFDFLVNNLSGALVAAGIWPNNIPTGIFAITNNLGGWNGSWGSNFTLDGITGDKAPVPVPTSVILLGSGLLGLIGIGRIFRKR